MSLIDSHCHLDDNRFDSDRDAVIERALDAGVTTMMSIGTGDGPPDLEVALRLADQYACVWATVGVHPHNAAKATDTTLGELEALLKHPRVLALGEIGLDYHYDFSPRDTQRALFRDQLDLARRAAKPVVIHTREAWDDTFAVLEEHWQGAGIMHCFSGGPMEARRALAMGFYISFAGVVTFPKAVDLQAAAVEVPLDRMLIETDAPYLAPIPHRGRRNEPSYVAHTASKLAELRGAPVEEIEAATAANFRRLMHCP
ncbi:MAG: TatD family hydrolase [Bryobacteraceae bacterium]|nr:TatD family hydrolase [Bryobacteraceae bacterium]